VLALVERDRVEVEEGGEGLADVSHQEVEVHKSPQFSGGDDKHALCLERHLESIGSLCW
jgi:hypothetical protein